MDGTQPHTTFLIDVGQGDLLISVTNRLTARVDVTFAGLAALTFPTYPLPEHFAEKIHAYTCPRPEGRLIRVKDLLDLSLLVTELYLQPSPHFGHGLRAVFAHYGTHGLPQPLPMRA